MTRAIYIRTSTTDQTGIAQAEACQAAACGRWAEGPEPEWYRDIGHSGSKASRPALDELRHDIALGKVREVMTYALDRLGRDLRELLLLLDDWTARGVGVVVLREGLDLATPAGRLQMQLLGAFAEFERRIISERVRSGVAAARARGRVGGRPRREVDVPEIEKRRRSGQSWRTIARALKVTVRTLRRAQQAVAQTP